MNNTTQHCDSSIPTGPRSPDGIVTILRTLFLCVAIWLGMAAAPVNLLPGVGKDRTIPNGDQPGQIQKVLDGSIGAIVRNVPGIRELGIDADHLVQRLARPSEIAFGVAEIIIAALLLIWVVCPNDRRWLVAGMVGLIGLWSAMLAPAFMSGVNLDFSSGLPAWWQYILLMIGTATVSGLALKLLADRSDN